MSRKLLGCILLACLVAFFASSAFADDYHYTNLLIGDRASGMGGAYTAIADDATGLYYNPAGIVYTTGRSLSASVNAYYDNEKTYKSVIGGNGWSRRSSSLLPNYFGVVQPLGKFKFGFSYAVPDSILEDQSQTFDRSSDGGNLQLSSSIQQYNAGAYITNYIINFNNENNIYEFGPSLATSLTENLSAGLTLYYYQKKGLWILNQLIKTSNGGFEETNQYYHTNEKGFRPILGMMWSPASDVSIGLSVSKIVLMSSDTSIQTIYDRQGIGVPDNTGTPVYDVISLPDGPSGTNAKRKFPTQVTLGAAWFPSQSWLLSTDINYFTAVSSDNIEAVTNVAVGTEYYFTKSWAMRGGLYTNYANTPTVKADDINQAEHVDIYGGTLSVSNFTRNTSVTVGAGMALGSGKSQIISNSTSIQTAESKGWMVFLSSSYSY